MREKTIPSRVDVPKNPERRQFFRTVVGLTFGGTAAYFLARPFFSKLLAQEQEQKDLKIDLKPDGTINVYNYVMRNGEIMPSSTESNLEVLEKLGAKGDEKMVASRRVVKKDGDFVRIRTYVKFEGIEKLLVLRDIGFDDGSSAFELLVAPASEWPKDSPVKK